MSQCLSAGVKVGSAAARRVGSLTSCFKVTLSCPVLLHDKQKEYINNGASLMRSKHAAMRLKASY
jgi:hypothetical protein